MELVAERIRKTNNLPLSWTPKNNVKAQAQTYFNNIQPSAELSTFSNSHKPRKRKKLSERLEIYYQTKKTLSFLYSELGNDKKAERLSRCGRFVEITLCENGHIANKKVNYKCENRLCPECSSRRSYEKILEFEPIIDAFLASRPELSPLHIILTQAQKQGETLKQARQRLTKAVKRLIERKFWNDSFAGSLNSYEFTISERVYKNGAVHFHLHLMAFCKLSSGERNKAWLKEFRDVWSDVSNGENKNLKVVPVTDVKSGLRELLKYICKPLDIRKFTVGHLAEVEELHRVKMTSTFGDFHKFVSSYRAEQEQTEEEPLEQKEELKEGDDCPKCKKPLFTLRKPIETVIVELQELERKMELRL